MADLINTLLELLMEERVKRGRIENELAKETAIRIAVENKNLELMIERSTPHTPPPTPSYDTHSGLETLNPHEIQQRSQPSNAHPKIVRALTRDFEKLSIEKQEDEFDIVDKLAKRKYIATRYPVLSTRGGEELGITSDLDKGYTDNSGIFTYGSCRGVDVGCVVARNDIKIKDKAETSAATFIC